MSAQTAHLYRMVTDEHICPYGIKSKWLLKKNGYRVEDHPLTSRAQTDAFMAKHDVATTPQTFIGDVRVGGYDALREQLDGVETDADGMSYTPVIAIFGLCALMAAAMSWALTGSAFTIKTAEWFAAFAMVVLAIQKLRDVESFSTMFVTYDLLSQRFVPYAYVYAFAEAAAGVLMIAGGPFGLVAAPIALFIGAEGAVSVAKAVYVDKRDLKCACVGGSSNVPLGAVSLTENLVMMAMGVWMGLKAVL